MDEETLEAFKSIVKEVVREETRALEVAMKKENKTLEMAMKEETRALEVAMKAQLESAMTAQLEDVTGVIHDVILMMESRMDKSDAKVDGLEVELQSVKRTVERIDDRTQNQVEALYEELRVTQREVKAVQLDAVRIKTHVGMPA